MELICPSCEARYAIPDGSIGEKGRQVSCMNCGNVWHAYPPLLLGASQAATSPSVGMQWRDPDQAGSVPQGGAPRWDDVTNPQPREAPPASGRPETIEASAAPASFETAKSASERPGADRGAASRSEQLAEIREMLAEVQSEDRAAATRAPSLGEDESASDLRGPQTDADEGSVRLAERKPEPAPAPAAIPEVEQIDALSDDVGDDVDPLRRRMQMFECGGKPDEKSKGKPTNVKKLRRSHDRRAKKRQKAETARSGAFLTGFLLVAIIASVMISLYLLHPQIIARVPAAEKPLTEYVATIDGLRVSVAETYEGISGWVTESLEGKV